jgi:hypothetical protein
LGGQGGRTPCAPSRPGLEEAQEAAPLCHPDSNHHLPSRADAAERLPTQGRHGTTCWRSRPALQLPTPLQGLLLLELGELHVVHGIIILINPNVYRPAIRSNALSCCTAAGLIGIVHTASQEVHPCLRAGDCHPRLRSLARRTVPGETTPE